MNRAIGVFDSGVGGLTVLDTLKEQLPNENLIYIGDNIHSPYGDKTKEQLLAYTTEICKYFILQNVKMIVLACNTTSANVLDELQKQFPQVRIVGVIHSTVHEFLKKGCHHVLVIATHATIQAHKYKQLINDYDKHICVEELETPRLVPVIESGEYKDGISDILNDYLLSYQNKVDSIILGCTHYPIVLDQIQKVLGDICYVSSSASICHEVSSYLKLHRLLNTQKTTGNVRIYTTGNVDEFVYSSSGFFNYNDLKVEFLKL